MVFSVCLHPTLLRESAVRIAKESPTIEIGILKLAAAIICNPFVFCAARIDRKFPIVLHC